MKRLKNIEDKSNTQLLAIRDIPRPTIKDDVNDEYKTIQDFKKELIDKNLLHKDGDKKFDNIVNKWNKLKTDKLYT